MSPINYRIIGGTGMREWKKYVFPHLITSWIGIDSAFRRFQGRRHGAAMGGGTRTIWSYSFHAFPRGIMFRGGYRISSRGGRPVEPFSGVEIHMEMDMEWKWMEMGHNLWKWYGLVWIWGKAISLKVVCHLPTNSHDIFPRIGSHCFHLWTQPKCCPNLK